MSITAAASVAPALAPVDTRMASLRAIYIIWYRDILRYWRDRWRLVASLAQPLLFLVVFGAGLSSSLGRGTVFGSAGGFSYIQFMYPGIIGMAILFTAIFGAMSIVWDREFGFLKEVLVAPIDRSAATGRALGLRPIQCAGRAIRADDQWPGAPHPAGGRHRARLRRCDARHRRRHVSAPRLRGAPELRSRPR